MHSCLGINASRYLPSAVQVCSDERREMLLSRVRAHLTSLRRYTYGKHIVARVEKLLQVCSALCLQHFSLHLSTS
jgi:hypothetical protein